MQLCSKHSNFICRTSSKAHKPRANSKISTNSCYVTCYYTYILQLLAIIVYTKLLLLCQITIHIQPKNPPPHITTLISRTKTATPKDQTMSWKMPMVSDQRPLSLKSPIIHEKHFSIYTRRIEIE